MIRKMFIIFLILFSSVFALSAPSCENVYSVLGSNFTVHSAGSVYGCAVNQSYFAGWGYTSGAWGGGVSSHNNTHMKIEYSLTGTATIYDVKLPYSKNYSAVVITTVSGSAVLDATITATAPAVINIFEYNTTHYNISSGTSSFLKDRRTGYFNVVIDNNPAGTTTLYFPIYPIYSPSEIIYTSATASQFGTAGNSKFPNSIGYFISYNAVLNYVVRADFKTSGSNFIVANNMSASNTVFFPSVLTYGGNMITPKISYFPQQQEAFGYFWNSTTGYTYLRNNSIAYIFDSVSELWYLVPAIDFSLYSSPPTVSTTIVSSTTSSGAISQMFSRKNCYESGGNYTWNISTSPNAVNFYFYKAWVGGVDTATSTGTSYSGITNTTGAMTINITDGTNTLCSWQNGTFVFLQNDDTFFSSDATTSFLGSIFILILLGLSVFVPFSTILAVLINDLFLFLSQTNMFILSVIAIVGSLIINYNGTKGLKSVGLYFAMFFVVISFFISDIGLNSGLDLPSLGSITDAKDNFATLLNPDGLGSFIQASVGFIISFFRLLIDIPAYLISFIFLPLKQINANLYSVAFNLSVCLSFGVVAYLFVKAYQVLSNRQIEV